MRVNGTDYRTVWMQGSSVFMINQNKLPFEFEIYESKTYKITCEAIKSMIVRGAGAIGATAGYAMAQACLEADKKNYLNYISNAKSEIEATRPTARNLFYAVERVYNSGKLSVSNVFKEAKLIANEDLFASSQIGEYGNEIIKDAYRIETHCNAGWLAFVDYGTALSPIYKAHRNKKNIFVWVDETRPRSQGARLTAWELFNEGVPHKIIPDSAGAYIMKQNLVDMMIVGADRIALNGDVANKIGTLEKAVIAKEFNIPFYVAAPLSTFDLNCNFGKDIIIEERSPNEGLFISGLTQKGKIENIRIASEGSDYFNPAFDVTPAKYITGIITEKGIINPDTQSILKLFS
ncbi:MAG: S-methyl-5-thioribose-1-phosphate isomerase [Bacteroidales bacterium]|nr:S-methyl-5-thioribose-1-phosphate isomerase [Bacteroidales bacterium]